MFSFKSDYFLACLHAQVRLGLLMPSTLVPYANLGENLLMNSLPIFFLLENAKGLCLVSLKSIRSIYGRRAAGYNTHTQNTSVHNPGAWQKQGLELLRVPIVWPPPIPAPCSLAAHHGV